MWCLRCLLAVAAVCVSGCYYAGWLGNARVSVERCGNEGCRFTAGDSRSTAGAGRTPSAAGADRDSGPITPEHQHLENVGIPGFMVGLTGFEPATSCSQSRRATKLRYSPFCVGSGRHQSRHNESVYRTRRPCRPRNTQHGWQPAPRSGLPPVCARTGISPRTCVPLPVSGRSSTAGSCAIAR